MKCSWCGETTREKPVHVSQHGYFWSLHQDCVPKWRAHRESARNFDEPVEADGERIEVKSHARSREP